MKKKTALLSGLLLAAALAWAGYRVWRAPSIPVPITPEHRARVMSQPVLYAKNYDFDPASAMESRIGPPPPFLLDWLKKNDGRADYRPYTPTAAERKTLAGWLEQLPSGMKNVLRRRLIGIYLVENFLGNGLSNLVLGDGPEEYYAWVVLNTEGFSRTLSGTLTGREASAFMGGGVSVECGGREPAGIFYALTHEITHAYDYVAGITPYVEPEWYELLSGAPPWPEPGWEVWRGYRTPLPEHDFAARKKLGFYGMGGGPKLKTSEAASVYGSLADSPFVSLYGSQNWAEDAAEMMVYAATRRLTGSSCRVKYREPSGRTAFFSPGGEASARAEALYLRLSR
ncbi:MAG TPA: hypothetical protein PKK31_08755 [Elusimicrobiales bacterium]|nr:hypothetical protein [Elusimicrobiales bacterium]